jgi:hypothetical protein
MVSIKTLLILNIIFLCLLIIYYFRVEITGFVPISESTQVSLRIATRELDLEVSMNEYSFCPEDHANITNRIENIGGPDLTGNLTTYVFNPSGGQFFSDSWENIDLDFEQIKYFNSYLNFTLGDQRGRYEVESHFYYLDNIANATTAFRFKSGTGVLSLSPPYIEKTIKRGDSGTEVVTMWLRDACENTTVDVTINPSQISNLTNVSESNIFLSPILMNSTLINFTIPYDTPLGDYLGSITFTSNSQSINVPITIHVIERDIEISITIEAPEEKVCRGDSAQAEVNITKNEPPGEILMNTTYNVLDPNTVVISNQTDQVLINKSVLTHPRFTIPESSEIGFYTFIVSAQIYEATEQVSDIFEVIDCEEPEPQGGGGGGYPSAPASAAPPPKYSMDISLSTNVISSIAGSSESIFVIVNNTGNIKLNSVKLAIEGVPPNWIRVSPFEVDIPVSRTQEYLVLFSVPENAASGIYDIKIKAVGKIESDTKTLKLVIGKNPEEVSSLLLEHMENLRTNANMLVELESCLELSRVKILYLEGEKSREKGLSNYRSKNFEKSIDWFKHSINTYIKVIDQTTLKIEIKIEELKNDKIGIFPIIGLNEQVRILEEYYLERNYSRLCEPIQEINRLRKLSVILWITVLLLFSVSALIGVILVKRRRSSQRKQIIKRVKKRLGEFRIETIPNKEKPKKEKTKEPQKSTDNESTNEQQISQ